MSNPAIQIPEENSPSDRHNTSERLQTEYNDDSSYDILFSANQVKKWLHLGIVYFCTFLLLILWEKDVLPIQVSIFPLILGDIKLLISSILSLKLCEK